MEPLTSEALFQQYFWPHYPPATRNELTLARSEDANPSNNPSIYAHLSEAATLFVQNSEPLLGVQLGWDAASIAKLSGCLTQERRAAWIGASDPKQRGNLLFNTLVHGSAYVGEVAVRAPFPLKRSSCQTTPRLAPRFFNGPLVMS